MGPALTTRPMPAPAASGVPRASADDLRRLRVSGTLTAATASAMRAVFWSYAKQGSVRLLVDLEAVESVDAAGVAALLEGRRIVEGEMGGRFYLRLGPNGRRALQQSCTIGAFRLWKDE